MVKISQRKLESLLFGIANCQFVGLTALTVPDMTKRGNQYFGKTVKISRVNGPINWRYSSAVNAQLKREGKADAFKAFPRVWGQRINGCPLVCHIPEDDDGPRFYLELKLERRDVGYFSTDTHERIPQNVIAPFLKSDSDSRQGTDREVLLRDYRLDHIAELRVSGEEYSIVPLWYEYQIYLPTSQIPPATALAMA
jgi:hypothetical protein